MKIIKAIEGYIIDCRTRRWSERTIEWYEQKLKFFARWIETEEGAQNLHQVTIIQLRSFVLCLQSEPIGHNALSLLVIMQRIRMVAIQFTYRPLQLGDMFKSLKAFSPGATTKSY